MSGALIHVSSQRYYYRDYLVHSLSQIRPTNLSMHKHSGFHHVIIVSSVMLAQRHHITENNQDDCKHPLLHESSCLSVVGNSKQYQSTQSKAGLVQPITCSRTETEHFLLVHILNVHS